MRIWGRYLLLALLFLIAALGGITLSLFPISTEYVLTGPPHDPVIDLVKNWGSPQEIEAALAASGRDVNEVVQMGESLLMMAVMKEREDVAAWLLEKGANPNGAHPAFAPLAYAVKFESANLVKLLLEYGADPDLDVGDGITPRWIAARRAGNEEIRALMEGAPGADE
jgi:ankyrin repeat protein